MDPFRSSKAITVATQPWRRGRGGCVITPWVEPGMEGVGCAGHNGQCHTCAPCDSYLLSEGELDVLGMRTRPYVS